MSISQGLFMLTSIALSAVPFIWIIRHIGAQRDRKSEGAIDGILLLGALACSVLALILAGISGVRTIRENKVHASWQSVEAELTGACQVSKHTDLRTFRTGFRLTCPVAYTVAGQRYEGTAEAGSTDKRTTVDRWIENHPAGSRVQLYVNPADPREVLGLGYGTSIATHTSYDAAWQSLLVSALGLVFFLVSRIIVRQRERKKALASVSQP